MIRSVVKLKATKEKRIRSDKDEGQANAGKLISSNSKGALKLKEKIPPPKDPKKKKLRGANSTEEVSQSSDEDIFDGLQSNTYFEDHNDVHRVRGKKKISKECEEAVNGAVSDFFESAWLACAERFFITSAPQTVSFELRNTWLRVVEAEWQDPDMRERSYVGTNRIFKRDEPALPLALDTWSRGAMEHLPRFRRESVLDPFLRDIDVFGKLSLPVNLLSMNSSLFDIDKEDAEFSETLGITPDGLPPEYNMKEESSTIVETESEAAVADDDPTKRTSSNKLGEGEFWNFDLDQEQLSENVLGAPPEMPSFPVSEISLPDVELNKREKPVENKLEKPQIQALMPARFSSYLNESTTDNADYYPELIRRGRKPSKRVPKKSMVVRKFSPSQCGGKTGSGVFRLFHETTSEALLAQDSAKFAREKPSQIVEQSANASEEVVQVAMRDEKNRNIHKPNDNTDDETEVQPLFEERTPRPSETVRRFESGGGGGRSLNSQTRFSGWGPVVEQTASDLNNKFLNRILTNLHGRFKRQAFRSMSARAKHVQVTRDVEDQRTPSSFITANPSKTSILSTSTMKSNRTGNRSEKPMSEAIRRSSRASRSMSTEVPSVTEPSAMENTLVKNNSPKTSESEFSIREGTKGQGQQRKSNRKLKHKNSFKTGGMGNVRASGGSFRGNYRSMAGKFQDSGRRAAEMQLRYEIMKNFLPRTEDDKNEEDEPLLATPSAGSIQGCNCEVPDPCKHNMRTV